MLKAHTGSFAYMVAVAQVIARLIRRTIAKWIVVGAFPKLVPLRARCGATISHVFVHCVERQDYEVV